MSAQPLSIMSLAIPRARTPSVPGLIFRKISAKFLEAGVSRISIIMTLPPRSFNFCTPATERWAE
jgi:hypothetical protein